MELNGFRGFIHNVFLYSQGNIHFSYFAFTGAVDNCLLPIAHCLLPIV